jgi:hypothetical protein
MTPFKFSDLPVKYKKYSEIKIHLFCPYAKLNPTFLCELSHKKNFLENPTEQVM